MDGTTKTWQPEARKRVFDAFYELRARDIMDSALEQTAFIPPHGPVVETLELFLKVDHAWVLADPDADREVISVILRRDLLRSLEPTSASYSRLSKSRFRSLAHGSADCTCCFTEGRVLHAVPPETDCREILHLMENKRILYIPVVQEAKLVGEIGSVHLVRAIHRIHEEQRRSS